MEFNSLNLNQKERPKNRNHSPLMIELITVLRKEGAMTRDELVGYLNVPRTTIYDGLKKLIDMKEVEKYPFYKDGAGKGRPKILFSVIE